MSLVIQKFSSLHKVLDLSRQEPGSEGRTRQDHRPKIRGRNLVEEKSKYTKVRTDQDEKFQDENY